MHIVNANSFWGRVKERAYAKGISLKALANLINEPYTSITNRISTDTIPKKKGVVEAIAKVLDCDSEYLVTGRVNVDTSNELKDFLHRFDRLSPERKKTLEIILKALEEDQEKEA